MTDQEKIEKVAELASKIGILYVAQDVYDSLLPHLDEDGRLNDIEVVVSRYLPSGQIAAIDESKLIY